MTRTANKKLNPDSLKESFGYAEPSVIDAKPGERFQFFRKGYYIADEKLTTDDEKVFNKIVGLKKFVEKIDRDERLRIWITTKNR